MMKKVLLVSLTAGVVVALFGLLTVLIFYRQVMEERQESVVSEEEEQTVEEEGGDSGAQAIAPVYFATMTHLEGNWLEAATEKVFFDRVADELRFGMDLAEEYDAILTFESEMPFAEGMKNFGDNVFAEALERGFGVGTHCDISPREDFTTQQLVREVKKRKALVDELVGEENNYGCSGVAGHEWYEPMVRAGFHYLDGIVGAHYITMDITERPDRTWTDDALFGEYWHVTAPVDEDQRHYPFFVNSDEDFKADAGGDLLVSAGSLGGALATMAEADRQTGEAACGLDCPLTQEDVGELLDRIAAFLETRDTTRVAKLEVYLPSAIFQEENEAVLRSFFTAIQTLQEEGKVKWASQKQVYEAVADWQ